MAISIANSIILFAIIGFSSYLAKNYLNPLTILTLMLQVFTMLGVISEVVVFDEGVFIMGVLAILTLAGIMIDIGVNRT